MSKSLSLGIALAAVVFMTLAGVALSYQRAGLALLALVLSIFTVGFGFIAKARARKHSNPS